ncbi:MAG: UDP-N-acetylmuramoyl-tripeptide--D-alanyl-D-alanine ligase [Candidatus Omnitrophica bacterium]|nr:UDP-N-acetylmuramoyl-tripeptide--D-alanyl-D-alanine ligase [Candidatus Omnitrophota bacterium]
MPKILEIVKATKAELIRGNIDLEFSDICIDTRKLKKGEIFLAIKGNRFDGHDFIKEAKDKGASALIVEKLPKIIPDITLLKVNDTVKALTDIAKYQRNKFPIPLIAITGSNGKTTTKEMLAYLLSLKYKVLKNEGTQNNQIGLSLTLLKLDKSYDIAVVELGTNHFGEIGYLTEISSPQIGVVLNIGPAHLEFFKALDGVYNEKISLIKSLSFPFIGILNSDDPFLRDALNNHIKDKFLISFGIKHKADFQADNLKWERQRVSFVINQNKFYLNTLGFFNVYNALAAITVCRLFGFSYRDLILRVKNFKFPSQRLEIKNIKGITFIDDTYNSNPVSLNEALKVLGRLNIKGRKIAVIGDMLELGKNTDEFHYKASIHISRLCDIIIGVGKFFGKMDKTISSFYLKGKLIFTCNTAKEAKDILIKKVKPSKGDLILIKGSRLMYMEEVFK